MWTVLTLLRFFLGLFGSFRLSLLEKEQMNILSGAWEFHYRAPFFLMLFLTKNTRIFHVEYEKKSLTANKVRFVFLKYLCSFQVKRKNKNHQKVFCHKRGKGLGKSHKKPTVEELYAPVLFPAQKVSAAEAGPIAKQDYFFFLLLLQWSKTHNYEFSAKFCTILFLKLNIDGCSKNILSGMSVKSVSFVVVQGTAFKKMLVDSQFTGRSIWIFCFQKCKLKWIISNPFKSLKEISSEKQKRARRLWDRDPSIQ